MQVHIVGAGPAGSIAAISALQNDFDVIVSEEHPIAGIPENCSGLFSKDGLNSLRDFIDYKKIVINPIKGANIHLLDEKLSIEQKNPVGYVCNRTAMDQFLINKAENDGAKINYGEKISGNFHANNIIGADGPFSFVARHFNFNKINLYASTLQSKVAYKSEDPNKVEVFLSNLHFPGFFGWIIPHDEYTAEFGVGVSPLHNVFTSWKYLLKMKNIESSLKPRGHTIPLRVRSRTGKRMGKVKVILVGDAAGQVKSTTGGGVIFGGNCARLAGKYVQEPLRYEFEWRLRYGPDLKMHGLLHSYLSSLSDDAISNLGKRLKKLQCDAYLSAHGHMDKPTRMIKPEGVAHFLKNITGVA
ncbi:NAD(P)/FAD-dependent oxidoreductase [Candidatus Micrarchaeota archaeon]|nr:NAD(P)/FAD-dependent oxidoreductase [Candidatus Micrarchaeota archaeon]